MLEQETHLADSSVLIHDGLRIDPDPAPAGPYPPIPASFLRPVNAFCVTLFNEDRVAVERSLSALLQSASHFHAAAPHERPSLLCLVADGLEKIDASVLRLLEELGLVRTGSCARTRDAEFHYSTHAFHALLQRLGENVTGMRESHLAPLGVIVCIKDQNAGKLHSHCIFFDTICRHVQPTFCWQIDTGTAVGAETVRRLIERFGQDEHIAAVAPRVMPRSPGLGGDFLQVWQYADFAFRKTIWWPFEVATGHLSVIPGQTGVFRWSSLQRSGRIDSSAWEPEPLQAYLRGLAATTAVDRLMFLAEDRVIGAEITLREGSRWKLDYLPAATAETDSCETFPELFRQRRRWNNSSMACRLWFLGRWPELRRRNQRGASPRSFTLPAAAQFLLAVREFFLPAQLLALIAMFAAPLAEAGAPYRPLFAAFWMVTCADVLLGLVGTAHLAERARLGWRRFRGVLTATSAALFATLVLVAFPPLASAILLAPALALLAMWLLLPRVALPGMLATQFTPVAHLSMSCVLTWYSMRRLSDVSWGTKGLTQSNVAAATQRQLRHWRNLALWGWLAGNALLVAVAVRVDGLLAPSLNVVVEATCILEGVIAIIALGHVVSRRRRR
jgi:cellulose synthase/poly-beta-1,6-N-acetylglucosamine synthase-like glycosyltransferase